jgi:hypothetical protein
LSSSPTMLIEWKWNQNNSLWYCYV